MNDPQPQPSPDATPEPAERGGVTIMRSSAMRIPSLTIVIKPGDEPQISPIAPEFRLLTTPLWLEVALKHVFAAQAHAERVQPGRPFEERTRALECEFLAAMQSIVASATAIDAFYACLKGCVSLPSDLRETWQKNRTPRPAQVVETVRRAFNLKNKTVQAMRPMIDELYRYRDWAVHPAGDYRPPIHHQALGSAVEWRFIAFSAHNAQQLLRAALAWTTLLANKPPTEAPKALHDFCDGLKSNLRATCAEWRDRFGRLTDDDGLESGMHHRADPTRNPEPK
jgi:hypothetical protein